MFETELKHCLVTSWHISKFNLCSNSFYTFFVVLIDFFVDYSF